MILCLDVGNSQIYGGVFEGENLRLQFRQNSRNSNSSDEYGLFLRSVLQENDIDPSSILRVSICTVVPEVLHSLRNACKKYFGLSPFVLQAGVKTGLNIKYRNPLEVGSDRIANAIAATHLYPQQNLMIVDFGTATTFCAINSSKEYLGGAIVPGLKLQMKSLESNTSKLPAVEIIVPSNCVGRSTVESIQSGLFFGSLGAIKEVSNQFAKECFAGRRPMVIATGGFASLFRKTATEYPELANLFDEEVPDLVLRGLFIANQMNM